MLGPRVLQCGRVAVRAVISAGLLDPVAASFSAERVPRLSAVCTAQCREASTAPTPQNASTRRVVASCCGFPKDLLNGPSRVHEHGVFGDDACFLARFKSTFVVGVADGVGGWRKYGIDPSEFSSRLMKNCEEQVLAGDFEPDHPEALLLKAFKAMSVAPPRPVGSSTACVLVVHGDTLYSANLGDSGFLVVRDGRVLARSKEQTHYFNAPFQLTLLPEHIESRGFIGDSPEAAERQRLEVQPGDVIVLATDGLWDNLSEEAILDQLKRLGGHNVQEVCNSLALTARRLAFDSRHESPFAQKASLHGISAPGGKPDDITLVLILIT